MNVCLWRVFLQFPTLGDEPPRHVEKIFILEGRRLRYIRRAADQMPARCSAAYRRVPAWAPKAAVDFQGLAYRAAYDVKPKN